MIKKLNVKLCCSIFHKAEMTIIILAVISFHNLLTAQISNASNSLVKGNFSIIKNTDGLHADSIPPDQTGMRNLTSVELTREMVPGWNIGNTLEAIGGETSWGNPKVTQLLIDSVKAAGFKSIRIPVAWSKFINDTLFTIDTNWLKRVEEVVNYVLKDSMYAIINEHWDGGWQQPTYKDSAYVNNRLASMWMQIAVHFRDYNDHLLFAGTNEVMVEGDYGTPKKEYYTVQNSFNQTFIKTVRSTGGRNFYRHLVVQGFNTNIDHTVNYFTVPFDPIENRLMVEVHYYDPYNFTLNSNDKITQWGMYATVPSKTETWANESYADGQFQKMKSKFVDKGFGVILGEYGATIRSNLGSKELNDDYESYRRYYMQYITRSIERHALVPYYWDIGFYGNHGSGIFDRNTGAHVYTDILDAIIDTSKVDPVVGVLETPLRPVKFFLGQNYPNPFNPDTKITYSITKRGIITLKVFNLIGCEIATLVNEEKSPGTYQVDFSARDVYASGRNITELPSGIYFYRIQSANFVETKKMMLIK